MMRNLYNYVVHGTPSAKDAEDILQNGFKTEAGRATVSADLLFAVEAASLPEMREWSRRNAVIEEGEVGRVLVIKVPKELGLDYAAGPALDIDHKLKVISGDYPRYRYGERQLAFYGAPKNENILVRAENILISLEPSSKLHDELTSLWQHTRNLDPLDLESLLSKIETEVMSNSNNFVAQGVDLKSVFRELLNTTVETTLKNYFRALSMDTKIALGYTAVSNDPNVQVRPKTVSTLKGQLEDIKRKSEAKGFRIVSVELSAYIKVNTTELLEEIQDATT